MQFSAVTNIEKDDGNTSAINVEIKKIFIWVRGIVLRKAR